MNRVWIRKTTTKKKKFASNLSFIRSQTGVFHAWEFPCRITLVVVKTRLSPITAKKSLILSIIVYLLEVASINPSRTEHIYCLHKNARRNILFNPNRGPNLNRKKHHSPIHVDEMQIILFMLAFSVTTLKAETFAEKIVDLC